MKVYIVFVLALLLTLFTVEIAASELQSVDKSTTVIVAETETEKYESSDFEDKELYFISASLFKNTFLDQANTIQKEYSYADTSSLLKPPKFLL
ncbi:hypothetical protein [Sulfurimonas sp. C5]|uniref:hypothetical protein n=1 Tax=Sulfurimonas sp. C5 TaxID=3036947 RepID=UPI00245655B7|nr:hypothetical protein [Sulfurimonas sp. C5]MDH4943694.1 hypothetical protein [Sulfurimonas sp. C5]